MNKLGRALTVLLAVPLHVSLLASGAWAAGAEPTTGTAMLDTTLNMTAVEAMVGEGLCAGAVLGPLKDAVTGPVASVSPADWVGSTVPSPGSAPELCGKKIKIEGPKGTVTATIAGLCLPCQPGSVALSLDAFSKISDEGKPKIKVYWDSESAPVPTPPARSSLVGISINIG
ncbi:hypothetical protein AB0D54_37410 [Streptomyces xanthophaeus]|uniref:hypothetical protein n=1 Tax=Streptomyces xanthophaeus TaxID=67385 RepID=UPI0034374204